MRSWALARPCPIVAICAKRDTIEAMVRGYHVYKSIWAAAVGEEFEALAKNRYRDIISICSSASDCVWHRSKVTSARIKFACLNFRSFYFRIGMEHTKYTKISTIRKYTVLSRVGLVRTKI